MLLGLTDVDPVACTLHAGDPCVGSCEPVDKLLLPATIK